MCAYYNSYRRRNGKIFLAKFRRAKRFLSNQLTTFEKQSQLCSRKAQLGADLPTPQARKATLLQTLGKQAHARTVKVQDLRADPIARHEQKQIARQWIATQLFDH